MMQKESNETEKDVKQKTKRALGKGLGALIPTLDLDEPSSTKDSMLCDIDLIHPNPYQPRIHFSSENLKELSDSIKEQGILQPLLVRHSGNGYELAAGERRLRAAKMAGLTQVPIIIRQISNSQLLEWSIIENLQREDLNPLEVAEAYHRLIAEFDLIQEQVAERVGKSRSSVTNFLRLRNLPEPIKDAIHQGLLSVGHARALLGLENPAQQLDAWKTIVARALSVRQTEELIKKLKNKPTKPEEKPLTSEEIYFKDVAENLTRNFGTQVYIRRKGKMGKIEIDFYNDEDLERLLAFLQQPPD